ncbi:MAG TPA: hypothetical protein DCF89_00390 [Flavobacteriales bacterium]|nr:hypothetical protein [Flavobacteriales bacterium]
MIIGLVKTIRPINLLIMVFTMLFLRYFYFKTNLDLFAIQLAASDLEYIWLVLSIVAAAGAGYVINDLFDQESDKINHPDRAAAMGVLNRKQLILYYTALLVLSFTFAALSMHSGALPIAITAFFNVVLFLYSYRLKKLPFVGNIVVSGAIAFLPAYALLYDIPLTFYRIPTDQYEQISKVILEEKFNDFIFFFMEMAFFINLVRELTKDILDLNGDSKMNVKTIPAIYGEVRSARFAAILTAVATIIMITHPIFNDHLLSRSYFIGATGTFLVLSMISLWRSNFNKASVSLKIAMFTALMYMPVFHFVFGHYDI